MSNTNLTISSAERRDLIDGTKVIWSTAVYVPAILCALIIATALEPILSSMTRPSPEMAWQKATALAVFFWGAVLLAARSFVWKPIRRVYAIVGDRALFKTHCMSIARLALPYAPLIGVVLALLVFDISGWFFFLQLGALLACDSFVNHQRQAPIVNEVDHLITYLRSSAKADLDDS